MKSIQNIQTKDLVVQILREQILSGDLKPGEELTQEDVAEKLGVSRMPVREALQALTQEGFLTRMCVPDEEDTGVGVISYHGRCGG